MVAKKNKTTREKRAKLAHELEQAKDLKVKEKENSQKIMEHRSHLNEPKPKNK